MAPQILDRRCELLGVTTPAVDADLTEHPTVAPERHTHLARRRIDRQQQGHDLSARPLGLRKLGIGRDASERAALRLGIGYRWSSVLRRFHPARIAHKNF